MRVEFQNTESRSSARIHSSTGKAAAAPTRAVAMAERQRKDFHFEFTTLRFRPLAEYGQWEGRTQIVPA